MRKIPKHTISTAVKKKMPVKKKKNTYFVYTVKCYNVAEKSQPSTLQLRFFSLALHIYALGIPLDHPLRVAVHQEKQREHSLDARQRVTK